MTGFVIVGVVIVILSAIINWKLPVATSQKVMRLVVYVWNLYLVFIALSPTSTFLRPLEQNQTNMHLFVVLCLLIYQLMGISMLFIPYIMRKSEVNVEAMVKQFFYYSVMMIGLTSVFASLIVIF